MRHDDNWKREFHERHERHRAVKGSSRFQAFLWGGILLAAGTWFLLERLGIELPNFWSASWPIFPFMFGLAFLVTFVASEQKDPGLVWPGTFGVLIGAFFFLFSLGAVEWDQMSELWPAFPLIVGLSFVATWFAGKCRKLQLLVPATINIAVGVVGLGFTLGLIDRRTFNLLWPLALVALGLFMIVRSLRPRRPTVPPIPPPPVPPIPPPPLPRD
jgi:hypothetical protein